MSLEFLRSVGQIGGITTVALTFIFGALALFASSRIESQQRAEMRSLDTSLAETRLELGKQQERAAMAEANLLTIDKSLNEARTEFAKQQERAAKAEKELLEIQERMKPRQISSEQEAKLLAILKGMEKGTVTVMSIISDGESNAFASSIANVLKAAGWTVVGPLQGAYAPISPIGAFIRVKSASSTPSFAGKLQRAFLEVGITLEGVVVPALEEGTVEILIGGKP